MKIKSLGDEDVIEKLRVEVIRYEEKLAERTFLFICMDTSDIISYEITFLRRHFKHLTGITCDMPAKKFYSACQNGLISPSIIRDADRSKISQKMSVINQMCELPYGKCIIGPSLLGQIHLSSDYSCGDTKGICCVGLREEDNLIIPVTLLRKDVKEAILHSQKVLMIYTKKIIEVKYTCKTYVSVDTAGKEIQLPDEITCLLS